MTKTRVRVERRILRRYIRQMEIYLLSDPESGRPMYVGKSTSSARRLVTHVSFANTGRTTSTSEWILGLKGTPPALSVLETVDASGADEAERAWISLFRLTGESLLNKCPGGDGLGREVSEASRIRMTKAARQVRSRSVECEDGRRFSSVAEAAEVVGVRSRSLHQALKRGHRLGGMSWRYV